MSETYDGDTFQLESDQEGLTAHETWDWSALKKSQIFMLKAAAIVGGGGFIYGYDIGVISGALGQLEDRFHLSSIEAGFVVACLPLGSMFGCIVGGPFCDRFGRWRTILLQNVLYVIGALTISCATAVEVIFVGRFIVGMGTALSGIADVPYLTEISPPKYRGRLSSAYEFLAVVGILSSFIVNLCLRSLDGGWRLLFAIPAVFALLQALMMAFLPDSPKWLIQSGHEKAGREALKLALDTPSEVEEVFSEICQSHTHSSNASEDLALAFQKVTHEYKSTIGAVVVLMFFQQFTGGVVVRNYAPVIFDDAGFGEKASLTFTVVLGVIKTMAVGWSIYNVDRLGRKFLLQLGLSVMTCGQAILSIAFAIGYGKNIGVFVIGCALILGGFSLGLGPVTWLLQSEIFPTIIRGRTMAVSVITRNLAEFLINLSFLPLVDTIDDAGTFFFFFFMCICALLFVRNILVETKEREPEEILQDFTTNLRSKIKCCGSQ